MSGAYTRLSMQTQWTLLTGEQSLSCTVLASRQRPDDFVLTIDTSRLPPFTPVVRWPSGMLKRVCPGRVKHKSAE